MNTSELRIGNWVKFSPNSIWGLDKIGKPTQIRASNFDQMDFAEKIKKNPLFEPIELTPHVMSRIKGVSISSRTANMRAPYELTECKIRSIRVEFNNGVIDKVSANSGSSYIKHLKYLHQLQNLYYSLTGKELEVEL